MVLTACFPLWGHPRKDLAAVQTLLLQHYHTVDLPKIIWSDNGSQFKSIVAEAVKATLGVAPRYIPPGHPQSNGLTEARLGFPEKRIPLICCVEKLPPLFH